MITYTKKGKRHYWGMNDDDFEAYYEIIWLLKHTPPPIGFNRKPFSFRQQRFIDETYDRISYSDDYNEKINKKNGQ
jgi:hypothetical protein